MAASVATAPERGVSAEWRRCPSCGAFVYHKRLKRNLGVCPECNHHFRLRINERLAQLLDPESFEDLSGDIAQLDALSFADTKPYVERIAQAERNASTKSGCLYGTGTVDGFPLVVAGIDFTFIGGSMGSAVGESITLAAELALETRVPLLVISASGGARMQEGCISLMQMAKTSQAVARLNEEGVPFISLLTDPTYGGVSASYATLGDILIAEPDAHIGFAGPTVIEQTIRQKLPDRFQTAEFLLEHGMLDLVEARENLRQSIRKILEMHARGPGLHERTAAPQAVAPTHEGSDPVTVPDDLETRPAWDVVQLARHIDRPTTLEYIAHVFDDFLELHGDRVFEEDAAIVGGLAQFGATTVVVVGHQKGHTTSEKMQRNFGMPEPEGYRKALRLMNYAARFGFPIVALVDTPGAYPGIGAEERGQSIAIARSIMEMSRLAVPIVTVVTGEGGSGGALALAVADRVLMMENSYYSVISPEGCSTILFKDATAAPRAAAALRMTAPDLLRLRVMDAIIREPADGAQADPLQAAANLKRAITASFDELAGLSPDELLNSRYDRFRRFGSAGSQPVLPPLGEKL